MFVPSIGQRIFLALALGLIVSPTIVSGAVIPAPHDSTQNIALTSDVNSISIAHSGSVPGATYFGTLDLKNNDLIVQGASTTDVTNNYVSVNDMVQSGYSPSQDWSGTGITSSTANADFNNGPGATGLGVIMNDDAFDNSNPSGNPLFATWDGKTVDQFSVLTKYTFVGDTLLRGVITGYDVGVVLGDFNTGSSGWINGDFFNQGNVTGTDVGVVLANFTAQHSYPFTYPGAAGSAGGVAVPEPATGLLALLAVISGMGLFPRRHGK